MFDPIFKENDQEQKHSGRYAVAEPELPSHRKPKYVVQNEQNEHKNPSNSRNHHDEITFSQGFSKRKT